MFEVNETAASLSFVALGANFLGTALLLLFNPRSRAVRWYTLFAASQLVWLLLQGLLLRDALPPSWWTVYGVNVHFMPAFFFAAVLVQRFKPRWQHLLPIVAAALVFVLMGGDPLGSPLMAPWQAVAWGAPALMYRRSADAPNTTSGKRLRLILSGIVPLAVLASILTGGAFILLVLPLLTVAVQLLIFTGIVHHRYYDIEVRAARSGELAAAAAEQDRLALLGELSATIAHEVRNPLTGIRSLTQLIAEAPLDDTRRQRYTGVILDEIGRLDRIVGNLTSLAQRTASSADSPTTMVPVQTLFEDLIMLVEPRARRTDVTLHGNARGVTMLTHRDAIAQALLNLLLNAVAHSPAGGSVHLDAHRADGHVRLMVRDEGPGVPAAERARIFEAFHTSGGTGLGLAVVRRLAERHGWTLDVRDADGGGAEFRIVLRDAA